MVRVARVLSTLAFAAWTVLAVAAPVPKSTPKPVGLPPRQQLPRETLNLIREMQKLNLEISKARAELVKEPELAKLAEQSQQALVAYHKKVRAEVDAATDTERLRYELSLLRKQIFAKETRPEVREQLVRRRIYITKYLDDLEAKIKARPEIIALEKKVEKARAAFEKKMTERLMADPKTAALLKRRQQVAKQLQQQYKRHGLRVTLPGELESLSRRPKAAGKEAKPPAKPK